VLEPTQLEKPELEARVPAPPINPSPSPAARVERAARPAPTELTLESGRSNAPAEDPFALAMTAGLGALDRGEFGAARDSFLEARRHQADSTVVLDGLERAETGLRQASILELKRRADLHLEQEEWKQAEGLFAQVLALDPVVEFALEGHLYSRQRADLAASLEGHTARPERLSSTAVLAEATATLVEAEAVEGAGPRHLEQHRRLAQLVASYSQPVQAHLLSNNETEVTVYQVGRLGAFESRQIELRPGRYTVVGSRTGYRDIRLSLVVEPGVTPPPLVVSCEEEI